jgi:hypothetical protein
MSLGLLSNAFSESIPMIMQFFFFLSVAVMGYLDFTLIFLVDESVFFCFLYSFIHMYIHCLGHFSPLPLTPSLSLHPSLVPGRIFSALISNFVEQKV